jgi:hypothetical protein
MKIGERKLDKILTGKVKIVEFWVLKSVNKSEASSNCTNK